MAARARRRPPATSRSPAPPPSSHSRPCRFAGRPSGARPGAGRPYRVACRTTSWFDSTQVLDEPERSARARLFSTTVRNCAASKSASSRSKLNACPSEVALAYSGTRAGATHASATAVRGGSYSSSTARHSAYTSCTSSRSSIGWVPSIGSASSAALLGNGSLRSLVSMWATSTRKPSTPRSAQNRSVRTKSARTSGCAQFRSGCSTAKWWRYHCPSATRSQAGPPNIETQSVGGCSPSGPVPSRKTYRSRAAEPRPAASASWNQAWSSEVWLGTMSTTTRMPCACSRSTRASKSARVPRRGSTSR